MSRPQPANALSPDIGDVITNGEVRQGVAHSMRVGIKTREGAFTDVGNTLADRDLGQSIPAVKEGKNR